MRKERVVEGGMKGEPWFRRRSTNLKGRWGFIPINLKGWVALILLFGVNVFAGYYFDLNIFVLDNYLKMGVVFLLSIFIFTEFAKRMTKGVKR